MSAMADEPRQPPRGDVVMAAQVAPEAIARNEAVETGLAEERSPVVAIRGPALMAKFVAGVLVMPRMAVMLANAFVATAFFGARSAIAVVGRCEGGSRQQDRGQSHHCDRKTRSVVEKRHGESPLACSDGFDACFLGKFTCAPDARSKENTQRMRGSH